MSRLRHAKTSFTAGALSPRLLGRGDLRAYANGAAVLENVFIHPTGGVSRRAGLRYLATLRGAGRLVAFEFNTEQVYVIAFSAGWIEVFRDGVKVAEELAPWTESQIAGINWTQSADTLLVVHPEVEPKRITRLADDDWLISDWPFREDEQEWSMPYYNFSDPEITLTPSATSGSVTFTASADVFEPGHVGTYIQYRVVWAKVTSYVSATQVVATPLETLPGTDASGIWQEQAFSSVRGWPASVCFHQDRLVIGGSRDLPNRFWMSRSGDLYNFRLGEGLDDEAIEFAILSDQVNAIRHVFSGRHLQIFTSGGEWMASGTPLTPTNVQLARQTRVGSPVDRSVPPRDVDGATLFVPREGPGLREFLFADVEQAYQATDLGMLAHHLIDEPRDQDFDKAKRLLHVVMADGTLGTLTIYRAEQVTAWTRQVTDGSFRSVAVAGDETYVMVTRNGSTLLETFDETLWVDSGLLGVASPAQDTWSGLDHLEGSTVKVVADGAARAGAVVSAGAVVLDEVAAVVTIGLPYTHRIEALPPAFDKGAGMQGARVRLVSLSLRLHETAALHLDTGKGLVEVPFKRFGDDLLDAPPPVFSGDKTLRAFGWRRNGIEPLWRIEQDAPFPFTLLSVNAEISANA